MNILYLCHRVPFPPRRGGKIRPFNMIAHLSRSHRVTVASLARNEAERTEAAGLEGICEKLICEVIPFATASIQMAARAPTPVPFSMGYFYSRQLRQRIDALLRKESFDLVFVHCSSVAQYVESVADVPKILDFGDMDSQKWRSYSRYRPFPVSLVYALEARKLEAEECRLAKLFDLCTCTTKQELDTLEEYGTGVRADWFPNGVDHEYFAPASEQCEPDTISFVGRMDYYPNQEAMLRFCSTTLPLVRARRPSVRLSIVGADPPRRIKALRNLPGVTVTGSVPDVRPYVRRSAVNVAPLAIARGTQNKILEAMSLGVPVVASELAARGVDVVPGEHLVTASTPEDEAAAIATLLEDPGRRATVAAAGRARVLSHHDWPASMRRLDGLIESCIARYRGDPRTLHVVAS